MSEDVIFNLELSVAEAASEVRKLELVLYRTLGMLRRLGLPEEAEAVIRKVQKIIMTVRLLHTALIALNTALIATSGGSWALVQWALAGVSMGGVAMSFSDVLSGY